MTAFALQFLRLEAAARRLLAAAVRLLSPVYPLRRARAWDAVRAVVEADSALWAELACSLGENSEATVVRPVPIARPYVTASNTWEQA